ncbi:MAG: hypothetical protein QOI54_3272 [Actinomycetota bacterium]|jgi:hypothetical protein|nr:hypothetical protein [Actinomycetota bacterium]
MPSLKRVLLWLAVAFVVYTIIVAPTTAADAVRQSADGLSNAGQSLLDFFGALVSS